MKEKIEFIYKKFAKDKSDREIYQEIISFAKYNNKFPSNEMIKKNLVEGCQSKLYITHSYKNNLIEFSAYSESLFSLGIASILIYLYSNENPKKIFTDPPVFLNELKLIEKISMNRQIGFTSLFKNLQLIASKYI